ncbi:MAG: hypothetical protein IKA42_03070 [Clostridia bacterium]|nr:hypothetical protein [Clostridia bacterium]
MQKTINVYLLVDTSIYAKQGLPKLQKMLMGIHRAKPFMPTNTKLHVIGYNDNARLLDLSKRITPTGNPMLSVGLDTLDTVIRYQRKYEPHQTKSVFILYTSGNVAEGWKKPLNHLFKHREFAFGLRYVVIYGKANKYARQAFMKFTDSQDKILHYFSESRLYSLLKVLMTSKRKTEPYSQKYQKRRRI